ncbi:uncharacterized protein LOC119112340 [Pollicipes pollicipes]|uniref:uncharacterized protein LOC119112340 n=1 Tax=Pollicipes pollicipes TaxID=41117 RepID=UPI0018852B64|nr:uncharacterized protein LOC119112340 [Pollicipes pollicipes]
MCSTAWVLHSAALLLFLVEVAHCLQLYEVIIPRNIRRGEDAYLACLYDLEGKELYSIKWYKDGKEFYRYEPSTRLRKKNFPQTGIRVDLDQSNATHVLLGDTTLRYAGRYMCEVSTEAPNFATQQGKGDIHIVVLPSEGPIITGGRSRYALGDQVKVNCTSHRSQPAAQLMWYINHEQAALSHLRLWPPTIDEEGLQTATVGLQFRARPHHFQRGTMQLKCVSQLADLARPLYWRSRELSAVAARPPEVSRVVDGASSARHNSSCALCQEVARWVIFVVSLILAR